MSGAHDEQETSFSPEALAFPFEALPPISEAGRAAVEAEALRINERYLQEFIEGQAFCPFSRDARQKDQTTRYVRYMDKLEAEPLMELMLQVASDPKQIVAQIIFPMIKVAALDWIKFTTQLTELSHHRIPGSDVLAIAALHPELAFREETAFSLIPLFRRAPDPTIQWVRLDALEEIYEGRKKGSMFVSPDDIPALLAKGPLPKPLYDRVAETNQSMAARIGLDKIVDLLADIQEDGQRAYKRVSREHLGS